MNQLKVKLWGDEIGRLVWQPSTRRTYFTFNPNLQNIPDLSPLLYPKRTRNIILPIYGDDSPLYQGLPPFIADSLPDSWGNTLFDKWVSDNKIPRNKITPLYKLMFIGTRGMGALEYEPCAEDLNHTRPIDIKSLYDLSLKILESRVLVVLNHNDELTMQALLAVGTSAGGRQMKAIIAINNATGEIRSGQTDDLKGYDYYILKFGDKSMPLAEIEVTFFKMATEAGIAMEECSLFPVEGINHFLTKRFDRTKGNKIHVQTLAAINPEARSYEDLVATCRELSISESEIEQLYRRMVFNVMTNNTDDHNKNFAFLLAKDGKWQLAPAYDITFIFNKNGTGPNYERRLSIGGKTSNISKADLINFAKQNDVKNANAIINEVAKAIQHFSTYASEACIKQPWRSVIQKTLNDTLIDFGCLKEVDSITSCSDSFGRKIDNMAISINSKGLFEVSAIVNGKRLKRYVRPNSPEFSEIIKQDIYNISVNERIRLAEILFPIQ